MLPRLENTFCFASLMRQPPPCPHRPTRTCPIRTLASSLEQSIKWLSISDHVLTISSRIVEAKCIRRLMRR
jgi:hypothetical protein